MRLPLAVKGAWSSFCSEKRISQQDAVAALVEFVLGLDDRLASMVLRQLRPTHNVEMVEMLLRHYAPATPPLDKVSEKNLSPHLRRTESKAASAK